MAHALVGNEDRLETQEQLTEHIDRSLVYTSQGAGDTFYRLLEPVRGSISELKQEDDRTLYC